MICSSCNKEIKPKVLCSECQEEKDKETEKAWGKHREIKDSIENSLIWILLVYILFSIVCLILINFTPLSAFIFPGTNLADPAEGMHILTVTIAMFGGIGYLVWTIIDEKIKKKTKMQFLKLHPQAAKILNFTE